MLKNACNSDSVVDNTGKFKFGFGHHRQILNFCKYQ
jgi:hypothetical protein